MSYQKKKEKKNCFTIYYSNSYPIFFVSLFLFGLLYTSFPDNSYLCRSSFTQFSISSLVYFFLSFLAIFVPNISCSSFIILSTYLCYFKFHLGVNLNIVFPSNQHIPSLTHFARKIDTVLDDWRHYKQSVPTFGAILIDKSLTQVLLVQSFFARASWGFPKGKVNQDEPPMTCAIREVKNSFFRTSRKKKKKKSY